MKRSRGQEQKMRMRVADKEDTRLVEKSKENKKVV